MSENFWIKPPVRKNEFHYKKYIYDDINFSKFAKARAKQAWDKWNKLSSQEWKVLLDFTTECWNKDPSYPGYEWLARNLKYGLPPNYDVNSNRVFEALDLSIEELWEAKGDILKTGKMLFFDVPGPTTTYKEVNNLPIAPSSGFWFVKNGTNWIQRNQIQNTEKDVVSFPSFSKEKLYMHCLFFWLGFENYIVGGNINIDTKEKSYGARGFSPNSLINHLGLRKEPYLSFQLDLEKECSFRRYHPNPRLSTYSGLEDIFFYSDKVYASSSISRVVLTDKIDWVDVDGDFFIEKDIVISEEDFFRMQNILLPQIVDSSNPPHIENEMLNLWSEISGKQGLDIVKEYNSRRYCL